MEKYFSCMLSGNGCYSAYSVIYKNDPTSHVYIISDGDDLERAVFFKRLIKNFRGYGISVFNPFYDGAADGIYIKNTNTYVLSDGGSNRISPVLPGAWEKYISIVPSKNYPMQLQREIIMHKLREKSFYKKGCEMLKTASTIKDKIHAETADSLDEEKLIGFIRRFCLRTLKENHEQSKGNGTVRLLSSVTPLGLHTHYETVFDMCDEVTNIRDSTDFVGAVIMGIIRDYAAAEKIPFIMSPTYFSSAIPQFLIFPSLGTGVTVSDESHILPFEPRRTVNAYRFLYENEKTVQTDKIRALIDIEKRFIDRSVMSVYEGRDERYKYNSLLEGFSDPDTAKKSADDLTEKIMT
ncbi:MAG: hypothetical protein J1F23_01065 [Oscillospiraceae bacterium]|nr:hypothetical protein [Oscillospiraceae bacterium]